MSEKRLTPDLTGDAFFSFSDGDVTVDDALRSEAIAAKAAQDQTPTTNDGDDLMQREVERTTGVRKADDPYMEQFNSVLENLNPEGAPESRNTPNYLQEGGEPDPVEAPAAIRPEQDNQQPAFEENDTIEENPYAVAYDILRDLGLVYADDNFEVSDERALQQLTQQTKQFHQQEALHSIRSQVAHDPQMLQLFDYTLQGGQFANLPRMQAIMQQQVDYAQYDIEVEENQKDIVARYLQATGTPEKFIPTVIDNLQDELKLVDEAKEAKNYFVQQGEAFKEQEMERIRQMQYQEQQRRAHEQQMHDEWNQRFVNTLNERPWDDSVKGEIYGMYEPVQFEDGSQLPLYQYKDLVIRRSPELFQEYLAWLTQFDLQSMSFRDSGQITPQQETKVARKLIQNLQKKQSTGKRGDTARTQNSRTPNVNPYNEIR